ncbi:MULTISPECIES: M16 family metallopeptidase [unclassified Aureimonas]|uniref:M16 family metallopeptidase n=1 Tax=unclassified Aureimonas TaxID=2615206 RepID=UPI0006FFA856|nr:MULTISPECIES: pitrilysin family protein [unclassified Aureimonas]KQT69735.1 zinc protease [Aureimonas sp. Leaf427]KQT76113.1 zinc protease [Aureimonas sp. Leaf460]
MTRHARRAGASLVALLIAMPLAAQAQTAPTKPDATTPAARMAEAEAKREKVSTFKLANGLDVVVLPDHRAPVVTQMVWYKAGSADEVAGTSGIAHFLEHLMFKGTKTHPAGQFSNAVSDIGGEENAFTTSDYTAYYQQVPAEALETVMGFEADRMENLVLSDEAVLPERDVILEERRQRTDNDPGSQLSEAVQAALFQNSHYGIPVIGWRHEMEKLSREDAIAWYDKFYTPNNATLIVAGDVTADQVKTLAEKTFGKVQRRAEPGDRAALRATEPEPVAARTVTLTDERVTQPSFSRTYLVPSDTTAKPGEAEALDVLADVLGGGATSRLYRQLVVGKGIAANVGAFNASSALKEGQFGFYATPLGEAGIAPLEAGIDEEIAKVQKDGITADELERAKNRVRKAVIYERDSQTSLARRYGAALSTGRTIADVDSYPERIEAVTVDAVKAAAETYLQKKRSVTGYLLPAPAAAEAAPATLNRS